MPWVDLAEKASPLHLSLYPDGFELAQKAIRRSSFVSVPDLQKAIADFLENWNLKPKPFIWTAKVEDIMKKIDRARAKLEEIEPGCAQPGRKKKANKS